MIFWRSVLIWSSELRLCLQSGHFQVSRATRPALIVHFNVITRIIFAEDMSHDSSSLFRKWNKFKCRTYRCGPYWSISAVAKIRNYGGNHRPTNWCRLWPVVLLPASTLAPHCTTCDLSAIVRFPRAQKLNKQPLELEISLIYSAEVSIFFSTVHVFVPSWHTSPKFPSRYKTGLLLHPRAAWTVLRAVRTTPVRCMNVELWLVGFSESVMRWCCVIDVLDRAVWSSACVSVEHFPTLHHFLSLVIFFIHRSRTSLSTGVDGRA